MPPNSTEKRDCPFFLDLTLPALADNLALDEALLLDAEAGGPEVLRVWEWPAYAVVLGAAGRLSEDVDEGACRRDHVPIGRRASGGGTVLLGAGCLLYSLVLSCQRDPALREISSSYRYILGRIRNALLPRAPTLELCGTSDLALAGLKVSGNAQQRKRLHLLHHGSLLYGFDRDQVGTYLHLPQRQPEYRRRRKHEEFLANLPISATDLKHELTECWGALSIVSAWPEEMVRRLVAEKYSQREWTYRR